MGIQDYLFNLLAKGHYTFTTKQAQKATATKLESLQTALWRARKKGLIASPIQGFHIIITPPYRKLGCLPAEYFIDDMMHYLDQSYYVGLSSAAALHGASHQKPMRFMVITPSSHTDIICGQIRINFTQRKNVEEIPVQKMQTDFGFYKVSSPEATAMDLVTYSHKSAGLDNVATVLSELVEKIDPLKLKSLTEKMKTTAWIQRLGYLLEVIGDEELATILESTLQTTRVQKCALLVRAPTTGATLNPRWNIYINTEIEVAEI